MAWDERKHPRDKAGRWAEKLSAMIGRRRGLDQFGEMFNELAALGSDPASRERAWNVQLEYARKVAAEADGPYMGAIPTRVGVLLALSSDFANGKWMLGGGFSAGPSGVIRRIYHGGPGAGSIRIETDNGSFDYLPQRDQWDLGEEVRIRQIF